MTDISSPPAKTDSAFDRTSLEMLIGQRGMMWTLILKLVVDLMFNAMSGLQSGAMLYGLAAVYTIACLIVAYFVFRLANAVYGIAPGLICAAATFIPCIGLFAVLVLNGTTMDQLRKRGIKVGFMGATKTQVDELKAKIASSI